MAAAELAFEPELEIHRGVGVLTRTRRADGVANVVGRAADPEVLIGVSTGSHQLPNLGRDRPCLGLRAADRAVVPRLRGRRHPIAIDTEPAAG
jgi:hypothetical protein